MFSLIGDVKVWFFPTKKEVKKEFKKIFDSFKKRDLRIDNQDKNINELKEQIVSKDMIKLMIENEILKVREVSVRTSRTTPRTAIRKKADKLLNKAEICSEIASMLQKGLNTNEVHHQIVEVKMLCKKTCFFKYLKIVREQIARTPRTKIADQ